MRKHVEERRKLELTKVKICGLTNIEDALKACDYGADYVGFVFVEGSPRHITKDEAKRIVDGLPAGPARVGLFRDHNISELTDIVVDCGLDHVQLHGDELPEYCDEIKNVLSEQGNDIKIIKTFKVRDYILGNLPSDYISADLYLFDTFDPLISGGTGKKFDWEVLKGFKGDKPFIVAGGLTPDNVAEAISLTCPFAVDVSSGVESSPGRKDEIKMKEFIINAKKR